MKKSSNRVSQVLPGAVAATLSLLTFASPAIGGHKFAHGDKPPSAARLFPADFTPPNDTEWGFPLGGFGGESKGKKLLHNPVILVHGQGYDHESWDVATEVPPGTLNVRKYLRSKGYTDQEIWGVSYNGDACMNTVTCGTDSDSNNQDIYNFIQAVRSYTGAEKVDLVAHSLGVTVLRKSVRVHPELLEQIEDMVLIAGANHGTTSCRGNETTWFGCDQVYPGSPWLADINTWNPKGEGDETPGPTRYMTVYDGSGVADTFFMTSATYDDSKSPALTGADNKELTGELHFPLARGEPALKTWVPFILAANDVRQASPGAVDGRTHPATGSETSVLIALGLMCICVGGLCLFAAGRGMSPGVARMTS